MAGVSLGLEGPTCLPGRSFNTRSVSVGGRQVRCEWYVNVLTQGPGLKRGVLDQFPPLAYDGHGSITSCIFLQDIPRLGEYTTWGFGRDASVGIERQTSGPCTEHLAVAWC